METEEEREERELEIDFGKDDLCLEADERLEGKQENTSEQKETPQQAMRKTNLQIQVWVDPDPIE